VDRALQTLRSIRNAFAHSSENASLGDPAYAEQLAAQVYRAAQVNPLCPACSCCSPTPVLPLSHPREPALGDYLLLITILVAFLDAAGQKLAPLPPAVVMQFSALTQ